MTHHLIGPRLLTHTVHVSIRGIVSGRRTVHAVDLSSILSSNLMVLHLLNYLLHVLTCVLQLCELFLEADVEWFKRDDFLGR